MFPNCGRIRKTIGSANSGGALSTVRPSTIICGRAGVSQVVVAGIATSVGVESTARAAYDHGYHVVLVTDAMSDMDAAAHRHSVATVFPRLGETAVTADVLAHLQEHPDG